VSPAGLRRARPDGAARGLGPQLPRASGVRRPGVRGGRPAALDPPHRPVRR